MTGLRELADVLPDEVELGERLRARADSADPVVRAVVLDLLRSTGLGRSPDFVMAIGDPDLQVRIQAVRALVRLNDADALAGDADPLVRAAVRSLAQWSQRTEVAAALAGGDADVRAYARRALATVTT